MVWEADPTEPAPPGALEGFSLDRCLPSLCDWNETRPVLHKLGQGIFSKDLGWQMAVGHVWKKFCLLQLGGDEGPLESRGRRPGMLLNTYNVQETPRELSGPNISSSTVEELWARPGRGVNPESMVWCSHQERAWPCTSESMLWSWSVVWWPRWVISVKSHLQFLPWCESPWKSINAYCPPSGCKTPG